MSLRQKLVLIAGAALLTACASPTAPSKDCDVTTMGGCASR